MNRGTLLLAGVLGGMSLLAVALALWTVGGRSTFPCAPGRGIEVDQLLVIAERHAEAQAGPTQSAMLRRLALAHARRGDQAKALEFAQQAEHAAVRTEILARMAGIHARDGRSDAATRSMAQAMAEIDAVEPDGRGTALARLAVVAATLGAEAEMERFISLIAPEDISALRLLGTGMIEAERAERVVTLAGDVDQPAGALVLLEAIGEAGAEVPRAQVEPVLRGLMPQVESIEPHDRRMKMLLDLARLWAAWDYPDEAEQCLDIAWQLHAETPTGMDREHRWSGMQLIHTQVELGHLDAALARLEQQGGTRRQAMVLRYLGTRLAERDRPADIETLEQRLIMLGGIETRWEARRNDGAGSADPTRGFDFTWGRIGLLGDLARLRFEDGDHDGARKASAEALELWRHSGPDRRDQLRLKISSIPRLVGLEAAMGHEDRALEILSRLNHPRSRYAAWVALAEARTEAGDTAAAREALGHAADELDLLSVSERRQMILSLALTHMQLNDPAGACRLLDRAIHDPATMAELAMELAERMIDAGLD